MGRPKKTYGYYDLDEWIRKALPGIRLEDRWKIFREWQRWRLELGGIYYPQDDQIEARIKEWRGMSFSDSDYFLGLMEQLRYEFLPAYRQAHRHIKAIKAASKRWGSNRIKTFDSNWELSFLRDAIKNLLQA